MASFPHASLPESCVRLSFPPYVLRASPQVVTYNDQNISYSYGSRRFTSVFTGPRFDPVEYLSCQIYKNRPPIVAQFKSYRYATLCLLVHSGPARGTIAVAYNILRPSTLNQVSTCTLIH